MLDRNRERRDHMSPLLTRGPIDQARERAPLLLRM